MSRDDRRRELRRAEDCLELLEAARALGVTVLTPRLAATLRSRIPDAADGMGLADAMAAVRARMEEEQTNPRRERRFRHRRPAFDPRLLLEEAFPPDQPAPPPA